MSTSDSSDDEGVMINRKTSFKKSAKSVVQEKDDGKPTKVSKQHSIKRGKTKKMVNNEPKRNRSKTADVHVKQSREVTSTKLDGKYWNDTPMNRLRDGNTVNNRQSSDDDDDLSSSDTSSEQTDDEVLNLPAAANNENDLLHENGAYLTCRSPSDSFYLCQVLQNVYTYTRRVRIRWCAVIDEDGDDTQISIKTKFKLDYTDKLDPDTILMSVLDPIVHDDKTISLKKQHIVDTKRLLEKSIRGELLSSDDMMDLSTEHQQKRREKTFSNHLHFESDSENDHSASSTSTVPISPKSNKRKKAVSQKKPRRQPAKRQRRIKNVEKASDGEEERVKPKKKPVVRKTQLFKVQSNRLLEENLTVTNYDKEPFFEDNLTVPFISSYVQSKLAIRAVLINDSKLLKSLINDLDHVCSVHVARGLQNPLSAIHYAVKNANIPMLKILLDDIKTPKKKRCPFPVVSMARQSTGRANINTFGFHTAPIMASRGAKEGNNALTKDEMNPLDLYHGEGILSYALKNNCSREVYDLLLKALPDEQTGVYEKIHKVVQAGHRKLAASLVGEIKDNAFHGFNNLHHQVLLYDNEDLTVNRAASVIKKPKANFMITPIHCAAINPNAKYLKQLLNIMPEYNILDKYERRPMHFAAACEGSDPLEYLLSKFVSFNDLDRGGNSPLHIAVMTGRAINAEILLRTAKEKAESNEAEDQIIYEKFGLASINRMNKSRYYPLHLAVLEDHLNCIRILLEYGANVDILTSTASGKLTPLMLACQKGYFDIVVYLIDNGARVEARDRFKRTPLIHACMCGNADIVSYLLRLGANANAFDSSLNTALHYAIAYGWYFCVKLLLEAGANLNCVNSWQTTCLAAGFLKGHYGICDYLLTEHHVDINFKTDDGLTLVMLTVGLDISAAVVEQLDYVVKKHNADCTTIDANGCNAFHYLAGNVSGQQGYFMNEDQRKTLHDNYFEMARILFDYNCNPNQMNNKAQSPLMIALEHGNFILVDYLINETKMEINADISHEGKTLLHYFANKCDQYDLIQALLKLPINDEIKKMGQIFDNNGRTALHYCAAKFSEFCQQNKSHVSSSPSVNDTDELKKKYRSIVRMIEYCLESVECDPDVEMKSTDLLKIADTKEETEEEEDDDSDDDEANEVNENEEEQEMDDENETLPEAEQTSSIPKDKSDSKLKETSIFSLLLTVPFIDLNEKHPLEILLQKTKNPNVLHHQTHRTPLLEAIHLQQIPTAQMLINHPLCDINLSTSNLPHECRQTPFIFACKSQLLPIIQCLLEHQQCNLTSNDYQNNQAIHYYLQTSNRSNEYFELLKIFIQKLKTTADNPLNTPGKHQRTPLHVAVYHNLGTIDAIIDIEKVLIENGSDLFIKDTLGNLPIHNVFLNKKVGDDPVELCVLIIKAMKYQSLETKNNQGDTPLHLAVTKCSTVCVMLLQQHNASLLSENNLSNSIIGTCIASGHLNLFITFIQQSIDINLGKLHNLTKNNSSSQDTEVVTPVPDIFFPPVRGKVPFGTPNQIAVKKTDDKNVWKWKYLEKKNSKASEQYSLIYLIIQRDWQGALSLILNEIDRFHLNYIQILEGAISNNKLNLVLRLLFRLKDELTFHETNSHQQNFYHMLANMNAYDENLLKQILLFLFEYQFPWNTPDEYGSYPLHYACVKQNFIFINFLREKHPSAFNLTQADGFENTPVGLLFWSLGSKTSFANEKLRSIISSDKHLNCLCNYDNEIALNPLSFNYIRSMTREIVYPPVQFDRLQTSPLIHAIVHNNFQLLQFLLELNADVNFPDENKQTPLMYAVRQNNIDLVKLLLNKNYTLESNQTAKVQSFSLGRGRGSRGRRQKFFLGKNAAVDTDEPSTNNQSKEFQVTSSINFNAIDNGGRTCIHHLIQPFPQGSFTNNLEILRLLHSFGASLTITDHSGFTPLEYSIENNYHHLSDELRKLTKNPKISTKKTAWEPFSINDPNKNLLITPDFHNDAQKLIDDYISSHPINPSDSEYKVDPTSGMSSTGEVLIDPDNEEPYDVRLTKADVNYGVYGLYNFYRMQMIKHKSKNNLFFLFTRWGRIGLDEGQHQLTPFSTLDECRKEFLKVFKEKTGNSWNDIGQFEAKPKKYTLVRLNEHELKKRPHVPIDFDRLQADHEHPSSQLQSSIYKTLMRTFLTRQAVRKNVHSARLDVDWMPASQLNLEILGKARDVLDKIKGIIDEKEKFGAGNAPGKGSNQKDEVKVLLESIQQYTNEYYTLIPMNSYSDEKLVVIDNPQIFKQQEKLLDDLFQLELSYKVLLGAQANLKHISPLDYVYKSLNCQIEAMNQDQFDSQLILRYIWSSAPNAQVEQIFRIAREGEDERLRKCNIGNRYFLWHGTDICNLISILSRGLLVGSVAANAIGNSFGTGIYTADTFVKSVGYCSGVPEKNGERCFMLLCEVALGHVQEIGVPRRGENDEEEEEDVDFEKPLDLKKFQSRKVNGRRVPDSKHTITLNSGVQIPLGELIDNKISSGYFRLPYSEYIVFDEVQVALRYLVQFRR